MIAIPCWPNDAIVLTISLTPVLYLYFCIKNGRFKGLQVFFLPSIYLQKFFSACYPNNTIDVTGLPNLPNMTYFAIQSDGTNCTVTGDPAAGTAQIDGCLKVIA